MEKECDGGGNRHLSALQLQNHPQLARHFPKKNIVQAGVCSLMIRDQPWIVCPRRLLTLTSPNQSALQEKIRADLIHYSGLSKGTSYRVWSEVKIKIATHDKQKTKKSFDYTFDYIIAGNCRKKIADVADIVDKSEKACEKIAMKNQFTLARRSDSVWIDDFPADPIVIVEIMTSSTSGGNKAKRTQIGMAFEDAILHGERHEGPGINYRQVWARMVSQLISKSQVGMAWGGKTIWVLQDVLADYISNTTALDLHKFVSTKTNEVNILSFGYGNQPKSDKESGIVQLGNSRLFAGPISETKSSQESTQFLDIVKIGAVPPKKYLYKSLFLKSPCGAVVQNDLIRPS